MAHNFAFDRFSVNGRSLNEVGINALIAGEMGVSVSLVSGDDVLIEETPGPESAHAHARAHGSRMEARCPARAYGAQKG